LGQGRQAFPTPSAHLDARHKPKRDPGFDLCSFQRKHVAHSARLLFELPVVSRALQASDTAVDKSVA
jgi:hypothetical protein